MSDAEVAEIEFVAFTSRRKREQVACRLVVRRVKRLQPMPGDGTEQGELFATYRNHAFITNSTLPTVEADQRHRDHALVEQVIAELKEGPLAHLPSGKYAANAAWVAHAVIAFNIARATAVAAAMRTARWVTLRTKIINIPPRIAATGPAPGRAPSPTLAVGLGLGADVVDRDRATSPRHDLTTQLQQNATEDSKWNSRRRPAAPPRRFRDTRRGSTRITDHKSPAGHTAHRPRRWLDTDDEHADVVVEFHARDMQSGQADGQGHSASGNERSGSCRDGSAQQNAP